jgi:hypothetical protein
MPAGTLASERDTGPSGQDTRDFGAGHSRSPLNGLASCTPVQAYGGHMDLHLTAGAGEPPWVNVADCTLPTAERPLRLAEFDQLFTESLRSIERTGESAVRLMLAGDADLARRTQSLADAESTCCSFFTFIVTPLNDQDVAFDVSVPTAYTEVLDGLVSLAAAALGGAS